MENKILQYVEDLVGAFLVKADLNVVKRKLAKKYEMTIPTSAEIIKVLRELQVRKKIGEKKFS